MIKGCRLMETPEVWVKVSSELLAKLNDWSAPVEAMIVDRQDNGVTPPGEPRYDMIFRTHQCPKGEQ